MKLALFFWVLAGSVAFATPHEIKVFVDGNEVEAEVRGDGMIFVPALVTTNVAAPVAAVPPAPLDAPQPSPPPPPPPPAVVASPAPVTPAPIVASPPPVASPPLPPAPSIKGKLIWYRNVWDLKSPESGALVWLLTESEAAILAQTAGGIPAEPIPAKAAGWESKLTKEHKFPRAVANERGEFFFDNVPAGRYVLVIKGTHCKWTTPRDRDGKMRFKTVEVAPGAPVNFTFDFGRTADALK